MQIHVLGDQELFHFLYPPLQFLQVRCRNGNEEVHIVEILIIGQPGLQKISGTDGGIQVIKI